MKNFTLQMDDFEFRMFLGLHEFEKREAQRVLVSATIRTCIDTYKDKGFYDYDQVATFIRGLSGSKIETQEELAQRIRDFILEDDRVEAAIIHTKKPDIYPDADAIGIIWGSLEDQTGQDYVIQLDNLRISMFLGIHDFEKAAAQSVLVSATIVADSFYDYDALVDFIRSLSGTQIETQEELLERIHAYITQSPNVKHAIVHTRKPDIFNDARAIGIVTGDLPYQYQQVLGSNY